MSERLFPMLDGSPPLPWPVAAAVWQYLYAALGHGSQSLERVGKRGGFSYDEIEFFAKQLQERREQGRPISEVEAAPEITEAMVRRAENETAQYIYGAEYAEQCLGWDDWWSRQSECRHNVARECARAALRAALADKEGG